MKHEYVSTLNDADDSIRPPFLEGVARADQFSCWLRTHRQSLGLSCEQMSVCCGLDVNTWAALENCEDLNPSWPVLERLAAVLETNPVGLMLVALVSAGHRRYGLR